LALPNVHYLADISCSHLDCVLSGLFPLELRTITLEN
jgi:hypothetical protein